MTRVGFLAVIFLVLSSALGSYALSGKMLAHEVAGARYEDVYYLPPAQRLPWLTLGFDQASADLIWVRTLVYFGTEMQERGAVAHAFDYTRATTTLDPYFRSAYLWAASAGIYRPNGVTPDMVRESVGFLEQAIQRFPNDGRLEWELGATLAFELVPLLPVAEQANVRAEAAPHLSRAAAFGSAPSWMSFTSATMMMRVGQTDRAIRHLEEMYASVDDDDTRAQIAARLMELRQSMGESAGVLATRRFREQHMRNYRYLSEGMFYLVAATDS